MRLNRTVVLAAVLAAQVASAQWTNSYGYSFNNPVSASVNQMIWDRINQGMLLRMMLKKKGFTDEQLKGLSNEQLLAKLGGAKKAAEESKTVQLGNASKFKPAGKRLLVNELATNLSKDPAQQKVLRELFEQSIKAFEAEASKEGFANDLAGATAFFLGTAYYVFHDGGEPDPDGLTLVARQLQQVFDTPEMKKAPDADKQKLYELLIGMAGWLGVTWQVAAKENDEALKAKMKETAGSILKGYFKLEPQQVQITAAGLSVAR